MLACIFSLSGKEVTPAEQQFFAKSQPAGFILFSRNCDNPEQLKDLVQHLRSVAGWHCPVLIDQEGGRVQRLRPPGWQQFKPAREFGLMAEHDREKAKKELGHMAANLAEDLAKAGIDVNCAPVLDVLTQQTHGAIGDRAFSNNSEIVGELGYVMCESMLQKNIVPVIKHMPGHGRARLDSHQDLPVIDATAEELENDFLPFRYIAQSDLGQSIWGMVAHILFPAFDKQNPSSVSRTIIQEVIRKKIGFSGLLFSDDISMSALSACGDVACRARLVVDAGCDLALYCAGKLDEMEAVAADCPKLREAAFKNLQNARKLLRLAI